MSKTHTDSDSGTDAEAKPGTDAEAKPGTDAEAKPGTDAEAKPGTDAEAKPGSDDRSDAGAGSKRDTQALPTAAAEAETPHDDELPARLRAAAPRQWRNRATPWLFAAVLLAGGFLGGVQVQKTWGKPAADSSGASQAIPAPAFTPPAGTDIQETTGMLKSVTTNALTIRTTDGRTRTVKIAESTRMRQSVTIAKLKPGRPVTIQGSTAADGTVTATAVTVS
ncbi:hypothetical protein HH310_11730 [Actinoplanes sp. TBRC 11911]|uniref:hypothetical protein n=1 Tax=Actinoplanes sp. TBRC 11911 TaxID=2729386 RepID=UPI00145F338B|nr:hypothetical protein [Actinoplanes sp. TBRC 11911]NMO51860.1 hypothetical protein [Actinoplanes sp. TBRC 11911]